MSEEEDEWDVSEPELKSSTLLKGASKWDDEDVQDQVKDSWDAESDEEQIPDKEEPNTAGIPKPKAKKKKSVLQQKLEEKREKERLIFKEQHENELETEFDRKLRLRQQEMQSDLEHTRELIGISQEDLSAGKNLIPGNPLVSGIHLSNMTPTNRTELLDYANMLKIKVSEFENLSAYSVFAETVIRDLISCLSVDDTRKVSSIVTAALNEKQKQLKESQGKGKKKSNSKKGVNVIRGAEFENYADASYNEFDDFM